MTQTPKRTGPRVGSSTRRSKWTAAEVVHALRVGYGVADSAMVTDEWCLLTEVPLRAPRPGQQGRGDGYWSNTRTIDVLLVRNWSSGVGFRRIAVEVKVSRADYRNETDLKRAPAEAAAHQCYYAAPAGIIDPLTLPPGWGLIEVYHDPAAAAAAPGWPLGQTGTPLRVRKRPVTREPTCSMDYLVAACARRASRLAERIRRAEDDGADVAALRVERDSLAGKVTRREQTNARLRDQIRQLRSVTAAITGGQVCADCGHPIRCSPEYGRITWAHVDPAQETACYEARAEANRVAREAQFGTRYMRGWPDPVEPKSIRDQDEATL